MAKALEIPQLDKLAWVVLIPSVTFVASMGDNFSPFCETLATSQLLHERCAKFSQQRPSSWQIARLSTVWLNWLYLYAIQSVAVIVLKKQNRHTGWTMIMLPCKILRMRTRRSQTAKHLRSCILTHSHASFWCLWWQACHGNRSSCCETLDTSQVLHNGVHVFTAATFCGLDHKTQECTVTGKCLLSKVHAVMKKKLSLGAKPLSSQTLWLRGSTCTVCSSFALLHCSDFTSASQSVCKVLTAATFCMFVRRAQHFVLERLLPWTVAGQIMPCKGYGT